jgi:putative membrane protein
MVQHLLLMVIAAPLILVGARLPERMPWRPPLMFCWLAGSSTVILWHLPAIFALAQRSPLRHHLEHASFFMAGIVFWWPVVHCGSGARSWSIPIYLFLATLPCDALSAFLVFYDHVVYHTYASGHQVFGLLPLEDQALAGALMWVTVTFAYMIPALLLTAQLLSGERGRDGGTSARLARLQAFDRGSGEARAVVRDVGNQHHPHQRNLL